MTGWSRRDFLCGAGAGLAAAALPPLFLRGAAPAGGEPGGIGLLEGRLRTAEELGAGYLHESLARDAAAPARLLVHTHLADPARCGPRAAGWAVAGGVPDSYTWAVLREGPVLGNRSQWARISFCSTQTGVAPGEHGLVELRLCRGMTPDDLPLRIRVENGSFYILSLNGENILAGDRNRRLFTLAAGATYTLGVLLFQKGVYARLTGPGLPGGRVELALDDRHRFIPGRPGFGLRANGRAAGGELTVSDWVVTPVGPAANCRLGAIGDSITAGNDQEPEAESYVHLATRGLGQELTLNTGSGGSTTALDAARFGLEVAPFRPGIAWIEGGTNDIGAGVPADAAFHNMMLQAQAVTWGGKVVFSTVPPRPLAGGGQGRELDRLNRLVRESGRPFVDRHALVRDPADPRRLRPDLDHGDHIHITRAGHRLVAAAALDVFRRFDPLVPGWPGPREKPAA